MYQRLERFNSRRQNANENTEVRDQLAWSQASAGKDHLFVRFVHIEEKSQTVTSTCYSGMLAKKLKQ